MRTTRTALLLMLYLVICQVSVTEAQTEDNLWSRPLRLSSEDKIATEASMVTDQYGFVHAFWVESGYADNQSVIQYARFDGETWSGPVDIYLAQPFELLNSLSPAVDEKGTLYLVWAVGFRTGPAFSMQAPVRDALSAQNWSKPKRIDIPAHLIKLEIDLEGTLHILYSKYQIPDAGVYYLYSKDQGQTWSIPRWLDPDIPSSYVPDSLKFSRDETNDSLHAVWQYTETVDGIFAGKDIRYIYSADRGETWSPPFTIDADSDDSGKLRAADPVLAVHNKNVHIIWGSGGSIIQRAHRYSTDGGKSWSDIARIFGGLDGQAFDGLIADWTGRFHYFGQIRFPQGIYHAYWDQDHWSEPSLIYFIRFSAEDSLGGNVMAHYTYPIVRAGNQLIVTFTDNPSNSQRSLYVMQRTLNDIAPLPEVPTPVPTLEATPTLPTPIEPTPTMAPPPFVVSQSSSPGDVPSLGGGVWVGVLLALVLTGGVVTFQWLRKR